MPDSCELECSSKVSSGIELIGDGDRDRDRDRDRTRECLVPGAGDGESDRDRDRDGEVRISNSNSRWVCSLCTELASQASSESALGRGCVLNAGSPAVP